jgi:putative endonuclease
MEKCDGAAENWYVYVLLCADTTFYTGITTDLSRRILEHNGGRLGARYTRPRRPVRLAYFETFDGRSKASKREAAIKKMSRSEKRALVATQAQLHEMV